MTSAEFIEALRSGEQRAECRARLRVMPTSELLGHYAGMILAVASGDDIPAYATGLIANEIDERIPVRQEDEPS